MKGIKTKDMFNWMITIQPTYNNRFKKIPINELLKSYKYIILDYYDKKYNRKAHLHKEEQYKQMICSHLYETNSADREYLIRNDYTDTLRELYHPHLHCLIQCPNNEIMDFFFFIKKKMRMKYPLSSCDLVKINQLEEDQIRVIQYGDKEQSIFYTKTDLINGVI